MRHGGDGLFCHGRHSVLDILTLFACFFTFSGFIKIFIISIFRIIKNCMQIFLLAYIDVMLWW